MAAALSTTYPFTVHFIRMVQTFEGPAIMVQDATAYGSRELAEAFQADTMDGGVAGTERVVCSDCGQDGCPGFYKSDANHQLAF